MTKLIVVVGASGQQGGGVVNILLKTPGWKVRAITRNPSSDKGKELVSKGAEVVSANLDDEASLLKAFEGAHAVFGVTNFWEHLFTGKSQDESGELEAKQAWNLATAAAKTSTLEHYIWSTLPSAKKLSGGKNKCAHLDYKADVDERIKKELPDLAKKTTFLFFGYYPSNMVFFPQMKPFELPNSYGKYLQIIPADPKSGIIVSGDMTITPGVWVRQILANPDKTHGKYASVAPEFLSWAEMVKIWSEVSGRQGVVVQTSREDFVNIWGVGGAELADQLEFGETIKDWTAGNPFVSKEELGIKKEEIPGLRQTLEGFKAIL